MKTSTTLSDVLDTITADADAVDVFEDQATALVRKGVTQFVVMRNDDDPGRFDITVHAHESEDDAQTCHAWKVGLLTNPIGAMLSRMFGQAMFDQGQPGEGFYL